MIKKESRFPSESGAPFRALQADLRAGEGVVLVRDEQDDLLPCGPRDAALRRGAVVRVESGERLVERERVRGREQGAREGQAALHAAGPVPHPLASRIAEPQLREQGARGGLVVSRAEREAQIARGVELLEQAVLLKDRRPAEAARVGRAAVGTLQPQQNAQQRRFADAGAARDARETDFGSEAHALQHRCAAVAFAEIFHPKLHQAHHLSVSASTPRRNSPSNKTESSTITAVHAKRSAV